MITDSIWSVKMYMEVQLAKLMFGDITESQKICLLFWYFLFLLKKVLMEEENDNRAENNNIQLSK